MMLISMAHFLSATCMETLIMQQFYFNSRVRKISESIANYLAELQTSAQHCNFGGTLEDMLSDRLVVGINDLVLQRLLLAFRTLTNLEKATEIADGERFKSYPRSKWSHTNS